MRFVIVSGMSGAGKNTTLNMLEDMGFSCVDNLPVELLPKFGQIASHRNEAVDKVAVVVDSRNGDKLLNLEEQLDILKEQGIQYEILFLDAANRTLIKRYKESRRQHPLAMEGRIETGISRERKLVSFIKEKADYIVDTTSLLTRELKQELDKIFEEGGEYGNFIVTVLSFGFKYGIPDDADLVFDVRFLPNPYYDLNLRPLTGNDKPIQDFILKYEEAHVFLDKLEDMISFLIPHYVDEGKHHLIIGIGCTGGKHRSVTIANGIYDRIGNYPYSTRLEHRDIGRGK